MHAFTLNVHMFILFTQNAVKNYTNVICVFLWLELHVQNDPDTEGTLSRKDKSITNTLHHVSLHTSLTAREIHIQQHVDLQRIM